MPIIYPCMSEVKISIVTVCFNAGDFIERTMQSVFSQNYNNIEYVIVDGASKDCTVNLIEKYKNKISKYISEPDKGIYDAMNKGIAMSTGEWLLFMNAGDVFASENAVSDMVAHLDYDITMLRGNIVRKYKKYDVVSTGITNQVPTVMDFLFHTFHHQATFIRKDLFDKYGLYDAKYRLCSDWKFFFDCSILHGEKSKYINYTVALFETGGASSNFCLYNSERKDYLYQVYGKEITDSLYELREYRKSFLCRTIYKARVFLQNKIPMSVMSRLIMFKRVFKRILGLHVK